MTEDQIEGAIRRLFASPAGPPAMQAILELGGVLAAEPMAGEELQRDSGARALALDIATMAGLLPEVPGLLLEPPADRPAEAISGAREPGAREQSEEAEA